MGSKLLTTTERSGLSLAQVGGNDVYKMRHQVVSVLEMDGLGDEYINMFAEPVDNGRTIDWYVEDGDNIVSPDRLAPEEKEKFLAHFEDMHNYLKSYAQKLRQNPDSAVRNYADILDKAMTVPGPESLYSVDGHPVLANWGFSSGDNDTVEDSKKLIREIQKKRKEARDEILKAQEAANAARAAAAAEQLRAEAPEKPVEEIHREPEPEPAQQTVPQHSHSNSGNMLAVIIGALAVLAGLAAAWYFFWNKPDAEKPAQSSAEEAKAPDFSWLKGEHSSNDVLVNENQERVGLTFNFEGSDGKGKATVSEADQTCDGSVAANELADGKIEFSVSEIICPNKNNYGSFTLICPKGTGSCAGTDKNGETWDMEANIIGDIK